MMDPIMIYSLPAVISLVVDGIVTAIIADLYKKNMETINEFRAELRRFSHRKLDYGFVIPMYKNPEEVDRCLDDLINRVGVSNSKIVVIDDFSNDRDQTKRAAEEYGVEILEISQEEKDVRKIRAQRKGVQTWLARGKEYVICLDSDCYIKTGLNNLESAMSEMDFFDLDAMAGQILPSIEKNFNLLERIQYVEYKQAMRAGRGFMYALTKHYKDEVSSKDDLKSKYSLKQASQLNISGAFGIFRPALLKEVLDEMNVYGGGEDTEITLRLLAKKAKIGYNNGIIVETEVPRKVSVWFRQRDFWSQFSLSYFFDSGYIVDIFKKIDGQWKPKYNVAGLSFGIQLLRDVTHPLKLASLPYLISNLPLFAVIMAIYTTMSWYCSSKVKEKEEQVDGGAELLLPFYRLGQLIGPMTVGYGKQFGRIFNLKGRSKNKEHKIFCTALTYATDTLQGLRMIKGR